MKIMLSATCGILVIAAVTTVDGSYFVSIISVLAMIFFRWCQRLKTGSQWTPCPETAEYTLGASNGGAHPHQDTCGQAEEKFSSSSQH